MEMKVEKSFFMLEKKGEKRTVILYNMLDEAVKKIAEYLKAGLPADQIELSEINVEEKELKIKVVPWGIIAERLVKGTR
jgi:predicted oxidoreductase